MRAAKKPIARVSINMIYKLKLQKKNPGGPLDQISTP